ncbi:hypothetical protein ACNJX9_31220 [Bradyrhizobium sp. DASA03076]|uniref:hypothetical protein n=1 Tax=Bradyrhizobium sp. BLXBL-03 TaxID=3395916 RepID=UPI003F702CAD
MFGIRHLVDSAEVQLTELLYDTGVIADSHANLHGNVLLYDDIAELADIADVTEAEEAVMSMMMPVMPTTHGVEFCIDQFAHSTHVRSSGFAMNNMWLEPY